MRIHIFLTIFLLFLFSFASPNQDPHPNHEHNNNNHPDEHHNIHHHPHPVEGQNNDHHPHPAVNEHPHHPHPVEGQNNDHHHHPHPATNEYHRHHPLPGEGQNNIHHHHPQPATIPNGAQQQQQNPIIASVCAKTQYPDICTSSAQSHAHSAANIDGPASVLTLITVDIIGLTTTTRDQAAHAASTGELGGMAERIVKECKKNYDDALVMLENAKAAIAKNDKHGASVNYRAAVEDYNVCARSFMEIPGGGPFAKQDDQLEKMASNCLAVLAMV